MSLIWSAAAEHMGGVWGSWKDVNEFDARIALTYYLATGRTRYNGYLSAFL